MSERDTLKVYINDEVVDLRGNDPSPVKTNNTRPSKNFEKNCKSSTDICRHSGEQKLSRDGVRNISLNSSSGARNQYNKPFSRRLNARAISVDSRFRRKRTRSPEGTHSQSAVTLSQYSASVPAFPASSPHSLVKHKDCEFPPNDCKKNTGISNQSKEMVDDKWDKTQKLKLNTEAYAPAVCKTFEVTPQSHYSTALGEEDKAINTSEITAVIDYKYSVPVSQYWDDPRLLKKYTGLIQPRRVKHSKSSWSLPVYVPKTKNELVPTKCCECQEKNLESETYVFDDEETEADSTVRTNLFGGRKLYWPFYIIGTVCGIIAVTLFIWFLLDKDVAKFIYQKVLRRHVEPPPSGNFVTKIFTYIFGTIVYIVNKAIAETTHLIVVPREEVFSNPEEQPWWQQMF